MNFKDFETIFSNPVIYTAFINCKAAYTRRHDSEADKVAYNRTKRELKLMIQGAKV